MPWSYKGNTISQPGVVAPIDNSGITNVANTNGRKLVIVGSSGGGIPKVAMDFTSIEDAITTLQSGAGLTAVARAMRPAQDDTITPGSVTFVRVDPASQSTYDVLSGATAVLNLKTVGYGEYTKQANTIVKAGSVRGLQASITLGTKSFTQDNIYASPIQIQYVGASASAVIVIDNAAGTLVGKAGTAGSETVAFTASFSTYTTIQSLVNYINTFAGWTATIISGSPSRATANYFDNVANGACKATPYAVTANLDALKSFYNGTGLVTATRPASMGLTPTAMATPAYFTGGTNGTATNTDWTSALAALQNVGDARIIVAATGDATIHAMVDAHCQAMSNPTINNNRVQFAGGVVGESVTEAVNRASALNSRRTALVYPGIQDIDPITQELKTYDPFIAAAQSGAMLSSLQITTALTNQKIRARGLEGTLQYSLQKSDYDTLVDSGVTAIKFKQSALAGNGYVIVRSVTTWQSDKKLVNQEISMVCNEDYVTLRVADAIDAYLVGASGSPVGVGQVTSTIDGALRDLYTEGAIVGDSLADAYSNIRVNLAGDGSVTGGYNATIPAPMNFFGITSGFRIYSTAANI